MNQHGSDPGRNRRDVVERSRTKKDFPRHEAEATRSGNARRRTLNCSSDHSSERWWSAHRFRDAAALKAVPRSPDRTALSSA